VQERARQTLELIHISNDFLNRTKRAQQLRGRIDYMKLKRLLHSKRNGHQIEEGSTQNVRKPLPVIHLTRD
jgi:hypothetical protein